MYYIIILFCYFILLAFAIKSFAFIVYILVNTLYFENHFLEKLLIMDTLSPYKLNIF